MRVAFGSVVVVVGCSLSGLVGCSRKEPPAPAVGVDDKAVVKVEPAAPKPISPKPSPPAEETGAVKFQFDIPVDASAVITVSGNEYTPKELEHDLKLPKGIHRIAVRQAGLNLEPQEFTVEAGTRKIVRVADPDRRAAEWTIKVGGAVHLQADGGNRDVEKVEDLPAKPFQVLVVNTRQSKKVTDDGLDNLKGLKHVATLFMSGSPITDAGLERIAGLLPRIRDLQVSGISDAGMKRLAGLTNLEALAVTASPVTDAGMQHLRGLSGLRRLILNETKITGAGLTPLAGLTGLTELLLIGTGMDDAGLEHLRGMKDLWRLDLAQTPVTGLGFKALRGMAALREVSLWQGGKVTDAGLEQIAGLPNLRQLSVTGSTAVSDSGLKHLSTLKDLEGLGLVGTAVGDAGLTYLKDMPKLAFLDLASTAVTGTGFKNLHGHHLNTLSLWYSKTTDAGVEQIAGLPKLRSLEISGSPALTDDGLKHLPALKELERLGIAHMGISDAGLSHLKGLDKLNYINVWGTKVTDAGVQALRKAMPSLKEVHRQ